MSIRKTLNYIHDHGAAGSRTYVQTQFCLAPRPTLYTKHPGLIITSREICARLSLLSPVKRTKRCTWSAPQPQNLVWRGQDDNPAPCPSQVVLRTNHSSRYTKAMLVAGTLYCWSRENQVLLTSETLQHYCDCRLNFNTGLVYFFLFQATQESGMGSNSFICLSILLWILWAMMQRTTKHMIFQASRPSQLPDTITGQSAGCPDEGRTSASPGFFFGHHLLGFSLFVKLQSLCRKNQPEDVSPTRASLWGWLSTWITSSASRKVSSSVSCQHHILKPVSINPCLWMYLCQEKASEQKLTIQLPCKKANRLYHLINMSQQSILICPFLWCKLLRSLEFYLVFEFLIVSASAVLKQARLILLVQPLEAGFRKD